MKQAAITTVNWYHLYESSDVARESNSWGTIRGKICVMGICVRQKRQSGDTATKAVTHAYRIERETGQGEQRRQCA